MRVIKTIVAVALAIISVPATASPSVFIEVKGNEVFFNPSKVTGRVLDKQAGKVTTAMLTAFIAQERIYDTFEVCALSAVTRATYVGMDKHSEESIESYHTAGEVAYRAVATTPDRRRVVGQSVVFETCGDGPTKGAAILVYDEDTGEVMLFEELTGEQEHWFAFIHPNPDPTNSLLFTYSHCLECGARTDVFYDVTRQRIYVEYNRH